MKKNIILNNKEVQYDLKVSKRAKRMRLAIYCDGRFVVTQPYGLSEKKIICFIKEKADWILSKLDSYSSKKSPWNFNTKEHFLKNKIEAKFFVKEELANLNKYYNFKFNNISIRNQKTRWGSCSRKGNLNFNYRVLFLPRDVARYIVAHELCHLKEFNHSKSFWELVAETVPNHKELRKKLRF